MFRSFGWQEMTLILVIVMIVFGVGKLPQVGGALGKAVNAFRKAQRGEDDEAETGKPEAKTTEKIASKSTEKEGK